ncbi:MAG: hypothetical protein ACYTEX_07810 [Planctomycetota bacterium]|jgi:hypothetical protein
MKVKIEVLKCDAESLPAEVAIIGHKNTLKKKISIQENAEFSPLRGLHGRLFGVEGLEMLTTNKHAWSRVVSVKFRPRPKSREQHFSLVSGCIVICLQRFKPKDLIILPLSWRHPKCVALGRIYSIWLVAYMRKELLPVETMFPKIRIIDKDDPSIYLTYLVNNYEKVWDFVQETIEPLRNLPWCQTNLKRNRVTFDVSYNFG